MATDYLYVKSGRRYNLRTDTIRPYRLASTCECATEVFRWGAEWGNGVGWFWMPSAYGCGCGVGNAYMLPTDANGSGSVSVTVEGAPFTQWTPYDNRLLVRTDGQPWPCCQLLQNALGTSGTWSITYTGGVPPPRSGVIAAYELAIEYATILSRKPARVVNRSTAVNRQGNSQVLTVHDYFHDGLTGVFVVDAFIEAQNPSRLERPPAVLSPDDIVGAIS
jgi:hypothetical protein